ncbi:MAG: glycosyltransferase family protein [bacterium]
MTDAVKTLQGNRILIAPLDWGLGHATRCIPIIHTLIKNNKKVIIAAYGAGANLLQQEFPKIKIIKFDGVQIRYSNNKSQVFTLLKQLPKTTTQIKKEHREIKKIVAKYNIDTVISDNRFGLWGSGVFSIYITHQLMIKCPWWLKFAEPLGWLIHRSIIKRYDECWIPDYAGNNNLSGDLSHKYPLPKNAKFIGALSRFEPLNIDEDNGKQIQNNSPLENEWQKIEKKASVIGLKKSYENIIVISGPEPHRTKMEEWALSKSSLQNNEQNNNTLIVCGTPYKKNCIIANTNGATTTVNHLDTELLRYYLLSSKTIICRSGYTTIMDLYTLGLTATQLIPTPGQTEQEYLYKLHSKKLK